MFEKMNHLSASAESTWPARTLSALNRLLTILGYKTETDREKALARFLAWLAFVEAYVGSQDSEVRATWTEAALRALGNANRLTTTSAAEEAATLADGLVAQQLRRFPPRESTKTELDEYGPDLESTPAGQAVLAIQDAWRERDEALTKLAERDADLLKYAAEIDELRKRTDTCIEDVSDAKNLLAKILGVETSHPLRDLAQGVAEMVTARTRAAETLSEREASKLRADLQSTLRELATVREQCTLEKTRRMDTEGRISDLQKRALVPQDKPSKVEQGQRWVRIFRIQDVRGGHDDKRAETDSGASYSVERMGTNPDWVFLGYSF